MKDRQQRRVRQGQPSHHGHLVQRCSEIWAHDVIRHWDRRQRIGDSPTKVSVASSATALAKATETRLGVRGERKKRKQQQYTLVSGSFGRMRVLNIILL